MRKPNRGGPIACIFDVDGVLLASPHERAWREALAGLADPARFTTALYQAEVAGRPRVDGAFAALRALDVDHAGQRAADYAQRKQQRLVALIAGGGVKAFPDAIRFVQAVITLGWPTAVASSSQNARAMLEGIPYGTSSLLDAFDADMCGRTIRHGKPDPEIFLDAAAALGIEPARCLVVEDAPAGIRAAKSGGMFGLGVARLSDTSLLEAVHADLVVEILDEVDLDQLSCGRLAKRSA
jgi:HAD superfamily hydrolase (TIGR01509 family)